MPAACKHSAPRNRDRRSSPAPSALATTSMHKISSPIPSGELRRSRLMGALEAKFHKAKPERKSGECQFLSGRILAKSLVPEPKTSLKCSLGALVSGNKLRFSKKKFTFSPLFRGSLWKLITHHHCCRGIWGELPPSMRPRHQGSARMI